MKILYSPYMRQITEMIDEVREKYPKLLYGHYSTHSGRDTYISICVQNGASMKNVLTRLGNQVTVSWTGTSNSLRNHKRLRLIVYSLYQ